MKIGIVTCRAIPQLSQSERPLIPMFQKKNIKAEPLIWNDPSINWKAYDCLIFRSVWDYHTDSGAFKEWLQKLQDANIKTLNAVHIIMANQHKFYLRDLEEKGVKIVPTLFIDKTDGLSLSAIKGQGWQKAVIKPAVSASAYMTEAFILEDVEEIEEKYKEVASKRDLLVQKFMPEVNDFGELSILFFNRSYSHTVLKTAKSDDFRVQSEYGGQTKTFTPNANIIETAQSILSQFPGDMLYARVDGIIRNNAFVLMEIELIEPHLFFEFCEKTKERFVDAAIELIQ